MADPAFPRAFTPTMANPKSRLTQATAATRSGVGGGWRKPTNTSWSPVALLTPPQCSVRLPTFARPPVEPGLDGVLDAHVRGSPSRWCRRYSGMRATTSLPTSLGTWPRPSTSCGRCHGRRNGKVIVDQIVSQPLGQGSTVTRNSLQFPTMPEAGLEPARVSPTVFKTVASAIPPLRHGEPRLLYRSRARPATAVAACCQRAQSATCARVRGGDVSEWPG